MAFPYLHFFAIDMIRNQITDTVLMVRPACFMANPDTLEDNYFQDPIDAPDNPNARAQGEFDHMVTLLEEQGVTVIQVQDTPEPHTPDSIFPNNWFVTNSDGVMTIFPMYAENRNWESHKAVLYNAAVQAFKPRKILDLRDLSEGHGWVLEGTGAMVIDRPHSAVYASRSRRLSEELFDHFCVERGYEPILFDALDRDGNPIYHTNVMMALGEDMAVICSECIPPDQREIVLRKLTTTGHEILDITLEQVYAFAGNMLFLRSGQGRRLLVMSECARRRLTTLQLSQLSHFTIISPPLDTIEQLGGGSARCMMAEIFRHD